MRGHPDQIDWNKDLISGQFCPAEAAKLPFLLKGCILYLVVGTMWIGADGQRAGGAEALKQATGRAKQMTVEEARKILGIDKGATWEVIEKVSPPHRVPLGWKSEFCSFTDARLS
jgi:hypothetical protein